MSYVKRVIKKALPATKKRELEQAFRLNKAHFASAVFRSPASGMRVIGITGTNGKTSTCSFVNEIIKSSGKRTALYTTAYSEILGKQTPNRSHMTVASAWSVQKFFAEAKRKKVEWVILEITSHALDQYRISGVPLEIVAITNLSQDHLDYHGTMENYASAKARIITDFSPRTVVLNADDEWFSFFAKKVKNKLITIGEGSANYQIKELQLLPTGMSFNLISAKGILALTSKAVGHFNAYNIAMAATICQSMGCKKEVIEAAVARLPVVPGRMEPILEGQNFAVLVDYAHTPDALENVLKAARTISSSSVRIVFGATGDRDTTKRAPMGEVAAKFADYIYLTDDETYSENGDAIRKAVLEGIEQQGELKKCTEIADRREAIKQAFADAKKGDVVILAGIGHQDYRAMGSTKLAWDEREVARDVLREMDNERKT